MASEEQLDEMAARVTRAGDLLVAAETLAEEFGEGAPLEAVVAALKKHLAGLGWTQADFEVARARHERHPVYADVDEIGRTQELHEQTDRVDRVSVREAATGRMTLRSLLGGRRSSQDLIDERQALANCKPLSTAVLSVTSQEHEEVPTLVPRSTYPKSQAGTRRETRGATPAGTTTASRPSLLPSSWTGNSAASNGDSSGDSSGDDAA